MKRVLRRSGFELGCHMQIMSEREREREREKQVEKYHHKEYSKKGKENVCMHEMCMSMLRAKKIK